MKFGDKAIAQAIIATTSNLFEIDLDDLTGPTRVRHVAYPRFIAVRLIREETEMSFPEIARVFGGRDHTTIITAHQRSTEIMAKSDVYARAYDQIRERALGMCGWVEPVFKSVRGQAA